MVDISAALSFPAHNCAAFWALGLIARHTTLMWCPLAAAWTDTLAPRSSPKAALLTSAAFACIPSGVTSSGSLVTSFLHRFTPLSSPTVNPGGSSLQMNRVEYRIFHLGHNRYVLRCSLLFWSKKRQLTKFCSFSVSYSYCSRYPQRPLHPQAVSQR